MGRSQETFNKKEVKNKRDKKRKDKEKKRLARKDNEKKGSLDDMIAYVDENGMITSTPPDPNKKKVFNVEDIEIGVPKGDNTPFDPVRKGTVSFFNDSKGYGFIRDAETKESIFVHARIQTQMDSFQFAFGITLGQCCSVSNSAGFGNP